MKKIKVLDNEYYPTKVGLHYFVLKENLKVNPGDILYDSADNKFMVKSVTGHITSPFWSYSVFVDYDVEPVSELYRYE